MRFGVALIGGEASGTLRLKSHSCAEDYRVIMEGVSAWLVVMEVEKEDTPVQGSTC